MNFTCENTHMDEKTVRAIMQEFDVHNCDVSIREDATVDQLIDSLCGNRVYVPALFVVNKVDITTIESVNWFAENGYVPISVEQNLGLEYLKTRIWEALRIVRVYTKKRGENPDLEEAIYLKKGDTIEKVCKAVHKDLLGGFDHAEIWGVAAKGPRQWVGLNYEVRDGDVI